jgi:disulfide bond formation protein DsbB
LLIIVVVVVAVVPVAAAVVVLLVAVAIAVITTFFGAAIRRLCHTRHPPHIKADRPTVKFTSGGRLSFGSHTTSHLSYPSFT